MKHREFFEWAVENGLDIEVLRKAGDFVLSAHQGNISAFIDIEGGFIDRLAYLIFCVKSGVEHQDEERS